MGATAQAVLGKIISGGPVSATARRRSIPPNVDAAIRKALEKLPADRFATARDFAAALGDPSFRHGAIAAGTSPAATWNRVSIGATVAAVAFAAAFGWAVTRPAAVPELIRLSVVMPAAQSFYFFRAVDLETPRPDLIYVRNWTLGLPGR